MPDARKDQQAATLLKILTIGRQLIAAGKGIPQEVVFGELRALLKRRRRSVTR